MQTIRPSQGAHHQCCKEQPTCQASTRESFALRSLRSLRSRLSRLTLLQEHRLTQIGILHDDDYAPVDHPFCLDGAYNNLFRLSRSHYPSGPQLSTNLQLWAVHTHLHAALDNYALIIIHPVQPHLTIISEMLEAANEDWERRCARLGLGEKRTLNVSLHPNSKQEALS